MLYESIDLGDTVLCDICNGNWTNRTESGGILFGSYAVCPDCEEDFMQGVRKENEESFIQGTCPEGMQYRHWVLQLRGGNNTIEIRDLDFDEFLKAREKEG